MAASLLRHIVLLGDSTIDNVVWVKHRPGGKSVAQHLRGLLPDAQITNLAADGFTTCDLLQGCVPNISFRARLEENDPFPGIGSGEIFRPLEALGAANAARAVTDVVLSIGGNDVREILRDMGKLQTIVVQLHSNYPLILERIRAAAPQARVHLMLQYRPHFLRNNCEGGSGLYGVYEAMAMVPGPGTSVDKINHLMDSLVYPPILAFAQEKGLPILDLPNTFDIGNELLYECQIEPSSAGGRIIAEMIAHSVATEQAVGRSVFYSAPSSTADGAGEIVQADNAGAGWKVQLQLRN